MALDADAVLRGCTGASVETAHQLCRAELEKFRAAAAGGGAMTIACTQEAPLFSEAAGEVEGTVKGDAHGSSEFHQLTGAFAVDGA